jgi:integrase
MMTREEMLNLFSSAFENGILNPDDVKKEMKKKEISDLLKNHPYRIWVGHDGRWRTHVRDENAKDGRRLIKRISEESMQEALIAFYSLEDKAKPRKKTMTLRASYPKWIGYKSLHTTAVTYIERIKCDWKRYYIGSSIIDVPIRDFGKLMLDTWAHTLIKDYSMTKTQYYDATVIMRQALQYAVDLGLIEKNPFDGVKPDAARMFRKVMKCSDNSQVYTQKEEDAIKEIAWTDFRKRTDIYQLAPLAVLFQFQTGLRVGELIAARFENIEKPGYIHIQRMFRRYSNEVVEHTKTVYGDRQVILTAEALQIIAEARRRQLEAGNTADGFIFSMGNKAIPEYVMVRLYARYCKAAGMPVKSSHKVRKTYISTLIDAGCNINTVRSQVGHSDERTTLNNYCFDRREDDEKRRLIENALQSKPEVQENMFHVAR